MEGILVGIAIAGLLVSAYSANEQIESAKEARGIAADQAALQRQEARKREAEINAQAARQRRIAAARTIASGAALGITASPILGSVVGGESTAQSQMNKVTAATDLQIGQINLAEEQQTQSFKAQEVAAITNFLSSVASTSYGVTKDI